MVIENPNNDVLRRTVSLADRGDLLKKEDHWTCAQSTLIAVEQRDFSIISISSIYKL
jgi:hypothetical protein